MPGPTPGTETPHVGLGVTFLHLGSWETLHPMCHWLGSCRNKSQFLLDCLAWPDYSSLLLLIGMPLEHCIQFGTLVEAEANWRELRELWWVSSWAGDTGGEVGDP